MDPDATLARIIDAAVSGNHDDLLDAAEELADWLGADGFTPKDPREKS